MVSKARDDFPEPDRPVIVPLALISLEAVIFVVLIEFESVSISVALNVTTPLVDEILALGPKFKSSQVISPLELILPAAVIVPSDISSPAAVICSNEAVTPVKTSVVLL